MKALFYSLRDRGAARLAGSRFNPSRCLRAYGRRVTMELIGDLKLIKPQYRYLYRDRILSGSTGYALQALIEAWRRDHRLDKPPKCETCGQLRR
jgi:hypothetical protein